MIFFPNSKINIGLQILEKRTDGFHTLSSLFYPTDLCDILEIVNNENTNNNSTTNTELHISGRDIKCKQEDNLVIKALHLFREEIKKLPLEERIEIPPVKIFLHKIIPDGAGLGGGSADAAYCLKGLNNKFKLGFNNRQLEGMCRKLGSDCAFFIENKPMIGVEKGDVFEEAPPLCIETLQNHKIILRFPPIHISTKEAYSGVIPNPKQTPLKELLQYPIEEWKRYIINDFEKSIFRKYPAIAKVKEDLYKEGAVYASMSGSGSTVYGIFPKDK